MLGGFILLTFGEIPHLLMSLFLQFKEIPFEFFGWISAFIFGFSSLGHYFSHNLSEKIGNKRTLFIATFGCILFVFLATIFSKYISAILFVIPSLFFGLRNPIITHLLHLEVNSNNRATIISIYNSLGQLGLAIFFPVMGYLTDLYSINTTFKISALLMIIAPISYLFLKNRK